MAITFDNVSTDLMRSYEEVIRSYYREIYPEMDVSNGSVVYETVIRPAAAIYARSETELEDLKNQYSLNLLAKSEAPNDALADNLAANFNVVRREGVKGSGTVAVYLPYASTVNDVYIKQNAALTAAGVALTTLKSFVGVQDTAGLTDTDITSYRQMYRVGGQYAFLIDVVTNAYTSVVIGEATAVTMTPPSSQVTSMAVASAISGGSPAETSAELAARIGQGITAKVPSGRDHIRALLDAQGFTLQDMAVFGMGDPEMLRDRNNAMLISTGGRVDAMCRTAALPATLTVTKTATSLGSSNWQINLDANEAPGFYYISKITAGSNPRELTNPADIAITYRYETDTGAPEVFNGTVARYSIYQAATAVFKFEGLTGATYDFDVSLVYMAGLDSLQEYVNGDGVRNRSQDLLMRAPVPAYIGMDLTVQALSDYESLDTASIAASLASFVNGLAMDRTFLSVADLAVTLNTEYPNTVLRFPAELRLTMYMPDGSIYMDETTEGVMDKYEDPEQGVSARNTAFYCRPADINITLLP